MSLCGLFAPLFGYARENEVVSLISLFSLVRNLICCVSDLIVVYRLLFIFLTEVIWLCLCFMLVHISSWKGAERSSLVLISARAERCIAFFSLLHKNAECCNIIY